MDLKKQAQAAIDMDMTPMIDCVFLLMIFFVLCVAGLWGFRQLPIARFPDVAFPMVTVAVSLPGASPTQLESPAAPSRGSGG